MFILMTTCAVVVSIRVVCIPDRKHHTRIIVFLAGTYKAGKYIVRVDDLM